MDRDEGGGGVSLLEKWSDGQKKKKERKKTERERKSER